MQHESLSAENVGVQMAAAASTALGSCLLALGSCLLAHPMALRWREYSLMALGSCLLGHPLPRDQAALCAAVAGPVVGAPLEATGQAGEKPYRPWADLGGRSP